MLPITDSEQTGKASLTSHVHRHVTSHWRHVCTRTSHLTDITCTQARPISLTPRVHRYVPSHWLWQYRSTFTIPIPILPSSTLNFFTYRMTCGKLQCEWRTVLKCGYFKFSQCGVDVLGQNYLLKKRDKKSYLEDHLLSAVRQYSRSYPFFSSMAVLPTVACLRVIVKPL
jgi:hypothetical protein